jgi:hypothetical protein
MILLAAVLSRCVHEFRAKGEECAMKITHMNPPFCGYSIGKTGQRLISQRGAKSCGFVWSARGAAAGRRNMSKSYSVRDENDEIRAHILSRGSTRNTQKWIFWYEIGGRNKIKIYIFRRFSEVLVCCALKPATSFEPGENSIEESNRIHRTSTYPSHINIYLSKSLFETSSSLHLTTSSSRPRNCQLSSVKIIYLAS